jgi:TATA-binding protein-associated factor
MGLGKTLQTICIVASDHYLRAKKFAETKSLDSKPLPSLVVCPTSVTGHWLHEIQHYVGNLSAMIYAGSATDRRKMQPLLTTANVVITSYETVRSDVEFLSLVPFNYCVLDEGHMIKNPKSKITLAVKRIQATHRLILSGTPIQNNVLELWSLFDYLMPGFLGTEKQFYARYSSRCELSD